MQIVKPNYDKIARNKIKLKITFCLLLLEKSLPGIWLDWTLNGYLKVLFCKKLILETFNNFLSVLFFCALKVSRIVYIVLILAN